MSQDIPGYVYLGEMDIDELCAEIDDPNSEINQIARRHVDYNTSTVGCAVITLAGVAYRQLVVVGVLCAGSVLGCAAEDFIRKHSPCDENFVEVYVHQDGINARNPWNIQGKIMLNLRCDGGNIEQMAANLANDLEDTGEQVWDVTVETGSDIQNDICYNSEVVCDATEDIIDWGTSLF